MMRWVWALALVGALHAWLLTARVAEREVQPRRGGASTIRLIPRQAPLPAPAPAPAPPPPARLAKPDRVQAATPVDPAPPESPVAAAPASDAVAIAAPAEFLYQLRQNGKQGTARLSWQPQDGGYRLLLERELAGKPLPGWRSQGLLDEQQGLAPQRYATQRKGHDAQATNFRREEGLISFSASTEAFALADGVQDRISWWLQLAARVAGAPQRFGPGSEIRLSVVGLRAQPQDWVFEILGEESLALPSQVIASALHLRRAALGPYDGTIDIWLDPARAYLPAQLSSGAPDQQGWQLQLIDDKAEPRR